MWELRRPVAGVLRELLSSFCLIYNLTAQYFVVLSFIFWNNDFLMKQMFDLECRQGSSLSGLFYYEAIL